MNVKCVNKMDVIPEGGIVEVGDGNDKVLLENCHEDRCKAWIEACQIVHQNPWSSAAVPFLKKSGIALYKGARNNVSSENLTIQY